MIKLKKEKIELIYRQSEWAALFVFMNFFISRFLMSTTFGFDLPHIYRNITDYSVIIFGMIRLVLGSCLDIIFAENKKQRIYLIAKVTVAVIILIPIYVNIYRFKYTELMYLPFLAYCLYGAKPERAMKAYAVCIGVLLAATILSSLSGAIPNYIYLGNGRRGIFRGSYGIKYPTDLAAYVVFLFLSAWGSGRFRNWRYTAFAVVSALFMAYMIYTYPHGINGTVCSLLIAAVIVYDGLSEGVLSRHKYTRWITKVTDCLTIAAFPLFAAVVFVFSWLYGKGNGIAVRINQIVSTRLYWLWYSYEKYGLHWFGTLTPQNGGAHLAGDEYEFIDSSYGVILLRYGIILFVLVTAIWVLMTRKAVITGHRRIALVMAVIAFHSMIEQRFTEINILLVMPLCCFAVPEAANDEIKQDDKKADRTGRIVGWSTGTLIAGIFLLLVPKILSAARSLVIMRGWNGKRSFFILIFWLVCFAFFAFLGYSVYYLIIRITAKKKLSSGSLSGITVSMLSLITGFLWVDSSISEKLHLYDTQIEADKPAVELILESAEEPVYIGQNEELYKRSFNGISDHVLSPVEMSRSGSGSMLLDHDDEASLLIRTGARYAEISPYTGLFTFDDAVIESMSNNGYRFHGYYSAERDADLEYLARLNDLPLTENGGIRLAGDAHTLRYGSCISQSSGKYSVNFSLQLTDSDTDDPEAELCTLRASAMWGKKIWVEQIICLKDLDENGKIDIALNYKTGDTEGVEYLVFCRDGIELDVNDISWKKSVDLDTWSEYTSDGLLKAERYFDGDGEPVIQSAGYYGVEYEYAKGNEKWIRCRYLDADGKTPIEISSGYAQIERQYNDLKQVTEERYLDASGALCLCSDNYAYFVQTYDPRGNLLNTSYFDTGCRHVCSKSGYASAEYVYDDDGNRISERYLDEKTEPVLLGSGYAEIRRIYDKDHHVILESYYGTNGEPVALSKKQAAVEYEYDEYDNIICQKYTDINGDPVIISDGYAELRRSYDDKKRIIRESYYDTEGAPLLRPSGYAAWERDYDNAGNITSERYFDTDMQPVRSISGYAEIRKKYNGSNKVTYEAYYDTDGKPLALGKNQAAIEYGYDGAGNCVRYRYLDTEGKPVLLTDGWAELRRVYNSSKQIVEESFYDARGALLLRPNGYAVAKYSYDDANNRNDERYFDTERKPVRNKSGYAGLHRVFDDKKRVIKDSYLDENDEPVTLAKNQAAVEYGYDEMGNTVLIRYLDTDDKPVLLTDNYSELHRVYNSSKMLIEESYFDTEGKPSDIYGRYAKYENRYDDDNNLTLTYFTDAAGKPVQCGSSCFHEYLRSLEDRDITIFIAIKDDGTKSLTGTLIEDLKAVGIKTDLTDKFHNSFYAVITPEGSIEAFSDTETISHDGQTSGVSYTIVSGGYYIGNTSSVIINGEEYSKNTRGMNFVILDNKTGEVIDSVAFDIYDFEIRLTR